ncbi:hypothetical protein GOP47_0008181 [Adiantum capillus-veneris]|uniref:Uncharacterized protein n=1 Tax=Adiantum capillus-veneris TaxID=13818 RepID=A0A9D4UYB6_ADICA|nr:hypothetical protein GOP47_0008181 [Adiantum capillus-veneris]
MLDEEKHVLSFRVVGGEHRLRNYRSTTSLHELQAGSPSPCSRVAGAEVGHESSSGSTLVVESYVVDVPDGNSRDETLTFVDTVVKCNLQSLASLSERLAPSDPPCMTPSNATSPSTSLSDCHVRVD